MFQDAVAAYRLYELPIRFEPDALAAAQEGVRRTGLFLLGEQHKQPHTPRAIYTLMCRLAFRGLALEWESNLRPLVEAYLSDGLDASAALSEDGRITAGHFALLSVLRDQNRLERLILMDETSRDWSGPWTQRDAGMARSLLRERDPSVPTLVVAGAFHTTFGTDDQPTLASVVERDVPAVPSGALDYATAPRHAGSFRLGRGGRFVFALPSPAS